MAKAAATGGYLHPLLSLFFLLSCLGSFLPADTQTLSCNFSVKSHTTNGEAWYDRQCSVDGEIFLQNDNDNKAVSLGDKGKKIYATKECADLSPKLKDITEELRKQLLDMEDEAVLTSEPHTLQVTTESQYRQGNVTVASCIITLDGQYFFYFNPKNNTWSGTHDKVSVITKKLENITKGLSFFIAADSGECLKKLKTQRKETSRSTSRASDITEVPTDSQLSPTMIPTQLQTTMDASQPPSSRQLPSNSSSSNNNISSIISIVISIIIIISIIIFILLYMVKRKHYPKAGAPCCSSSSSVV